jgi:hypothetical protein
LRHPVGRIRLIRVDVENSVGRHDRFSFCSCKENVIFADCQAQSPPLSVWSCRLGR